MRDDDDAPKKCPSTTTTSSSLRLFFSLNCIPNGGGTSTKSAEGNAFFLFKFKTKKVSVDFFALHITKRDGEGGAAFTRVLTVVWN